MTIEQMTSKRSVWMALGILWVVFFHTTLFFGYQLMNDIKLFGYGGVDILLFASGMGCFCSYRKTENPYDFLKRRVMRLMPLLTVFVIIFYGKSLMGMRPNEVLAYFFASRYSWFIRAIWILYLLVPVFYEFVVRSRKVIGKIAFVLLIMLVSCAYWDDYPTMVIQARIPIFVVGMMLGRLCTSEDTKRIRIPAYVHLISLFGMILGFVWLKLYYVLEADITHNIALKWWPFILIAPSMCMIMSYMSLLLDRTVIGKEINKIFERIGRSTFEIFLIHLFWLNKVDRFAWAGERKKWILWMIEVACICTVTVLAEKMVSLLIHKLKNAKKTDS